MSEKSVAQKLIIKPGYTVVFVNPPESYSNLLGDLPPNVTVQKEPGKPVDLVQIFVKARQELEQLLPKWKPLVKPGGSLWVTYYKGTSKHKTDINRDSINAYAKSIGLEGVAMISLDEDWSALRLKAQKPGK